MLILNNKRVDFMIRYKQNILEMLKMKGYSTYRIKKEKIFNETQVQCLRENRLLTQDNLNKLCYLLDCNVGDILEYVPDEKDQL